MARIIKTVLKKRSFGKKFLNTLCVFCFCMSMISSHSLAYGAEIDGEVNEIVEARYANIATYTTALSRNNSTFTATGSVKAKLKASISVTLTLQRQSGTSWSDVTSWYDSTTATSLTLNKNYVAGTRGNYRVRAVYTVNGETITTYSNVVAY